MQRSRVLFVIALLGVALWFELDSRPPPRESTFSNDAIQEAVLRVQPALERALDHTFDPAIDVRVVTPAGMADVLAGDMQRFARDGNERDGAETWAPLLGRNLATMVFAKVELGTSRLNVTPKVFYSLDNTTSGMFHLTTPEFRDTLLLHEMVHVYQMRRIDAPRYFGRPDTVGKLQARASVIEGHAQYIAQRVARHLKLDEAFGDLLGVTTGEIEGLPESTRRMIRFASGMQAFPYYRGQQLVERVVHERGYEEGLTALLEQPPPDEIAVVTPSQYLPAPPAAAQYAHAVKRVARFVEDGDDVVRTPVSSVDLRLEWQEHSLDRLRTLLQSFVAADRIRASSTRTVELYRCRDAAGARNFLGALELQVVDGEIPWDVKEVEVEPGIAARQLKRDTAAARAAQKLWVYKRAYLMTSGVVCIVLRLNAPTTRDDADERLARRVLELVRSAYSDSPWSGASRDELAPAFIAALDDPHWGVRWRATRNLGRLPRDTPGVEAAALGALSDEDSSVRVAAVRTLETWGAIGSIPAPLLESLKQSKDRELSRRIWIALEHAEAR